MEEIVRSVGKYEVSAKNEFERSVLDIREVNIWTERIIGQLMAYIHQEDTDFALIPFLCGVLEPDQKKRMGRKQLEDIEKAANGLKGANYTLYFGPHHWRAYPLFEYIEFKDGLIEGKFNQALRPFLLGVLAPNFAVRNLPEFKQLKKVHSQIMYKLCNSWKDKSYFEMSVEDLKIIFRCWTQKSYTEFGEFNRSVLKPAVEEINKISTVMPLISYKVCEFALPDRKRKPKAKHGDANKIRFILTKRQAQPIEQLKEPTYAEKMRQSEIDSVTRDMVAENKM